MILEILIVILYLVLWVIGFILFLLTCLVLLPIVVRVDARRGAEPEATPQIQACVGPWYGILALLVEQMADGWEARLLLLGRVCVYQRILGTSEEPVDSGRPSTPGPGKDPAPSSDPLTPPMKGAAAVVRPEPEPVQTPSVAASAAAPPDPEKPSPDPDVESNAPGIWERVQNGWRDVRHFMPPTRRLMRRLVRIVGLRHIHAEATIGLEDAAQTGLLYGRMQAIQPFLPSWAHIQIEADFTRPASHGQASIRLHLYLARLLAAVARFAVHAGWLWLMRWWRLRRVARTMSPAATT